MTVWIYELGEGEYQEVAIVDNGSVTSGDEDLVNSAFPDGIPDDEAEVARMFSGTATVASTDFELDWDEPPEWAEGEVEASLGFFDGQGDTGNRDLSESELERFEAEIDALWSEVLWSDDTSKKLTAYSDSQLPEMVKTRMRDAIQGGSVFSDIDSIPASELMNLRTTLADSLSDDAWSLDELSETLQDRFDLSEGRAETIARTETQAAVQQAEESAYEDLEEERDEEFVYKWVGPDDSRETEACEWLKSQCNPSYGGEPVPLDELKQLVQEAPEHDPEITTEAREWTPHVNCRHRYTRVVD